MGLEWECKTHLFSEEQHNALEHLETIQRGDCHIKEEAVEHSSRDVRNGVWNEKQ